MRLTSRGPIRIVVNADDLGIRQDINEAIFDCIARGVVTSATFLANGPALEHALAQLHRFTACSFGVHLNLTQFQPVHPNSQTSLREILDVHGGFNGNAVREIRITPTMLGAIYQEWCAQVERLIGFGVAPSHFDAHHHVHTIPQMLPVMAALRRRFKINKARISRNLYSDAELPGSMLLGKKWLYNAALKVVGFRTTRIFSDWVTVVRLCSARQPEQRALNL